MSAKLPMSIETLQVRRIKKLEARIAQLEAGLARIKSLTDAPDLHNSTEEADRVMEWAVNEAEAALKETT